MKVVNTKILSQPINYLIVWLMLLIAAWFGHYILQWAGVHPHVTASQDQEAI